MKPPFPDPRKYLHIWEALKVLKGIDQVSLTLPRDSHKTVLNALRKEAIRDRIFRAQAIEKGKSFEIAFFQIGDLLLLHLRWKDYVTKAFVITPERIKRMSRWK